MGEKYQPGDDGAPMSRHRLMADMYDAWERERRIQVELVKLEQASK